MLLLAPSIIDMLKKSKQEAPETDVMEISEPTKAIDSTNTLGEKTGTPTHQTNSSRYSFSLAIVFAIFFVSSTSFCVAFLALRIDYCEEDELENAVDLQSFMTTRSGAKLVFKLEGDGK